MANQLEKLKNSIKILYVDKFELNLMKSSGFIPVDKRNQNFYVIQNKDSSDKEIITSAVSEKMPNVTVQFIPLADADFNYIYDYPREYLRSYSEVVIEEMKRRHIKIRTMDKFNNYFAGVELNRELRYKEHNLLYLKICIYNLYEKYIRGQKDYPDNLAWSLNGFIRIET